MRARTTKVVQYGLGFVLLLVGIGLWTTGQSELERIDKAMVSTDRKAKAVARMPQQELVSFDAITGEREYTGITRQSRGQLDAALEVNFDRWEAEGARSEAELFQTLGCLAFGAALLCAAAPWLNERFRRRTSEPQSPPG